MRIVSDTYYLMVRALRETARQPAFEITNIFIPMFFFAVTVGAIGNVAGRAFGVDNYTAFQMPVAILQAVAGAAGASGLGMVTDIERGYFDKLLLTPTPRLALVLGRLAADGVRVMILTALILVAGLFAGSGMESGVLGFIVILLMGGAFGLAYAGIGVAIALKTGSAQAAQTGFLLFFPLLFLSPAFAPKEVFAGWLEFLATINPVTYILEGMRSLVLDGWDAQSLAAAFGSIAGFTVLTMTLVMLGLRSRTA
ncbi:MAG TPA: ABC transporter permease [Dehalococcoidia bacterium]|jgi:ABC-2 type transport system permease protein|nr:ABC transporter permease [Dehalococcoidia bacterium]